ncbi:MAG: hypothetical protein ACREIM_00815 [Nitrospiraceae bacterium]
MNAKSSIHSSDVCRTLRQKDFVRVIILVMTFLSVLPTATRGEFQITSDPFADNELAAVILVEDKGRDVEGKLGAPCVVGASNRETISLAYRAADGTFLQFVVNVSPSDVNYQLVESMTMSVEPSVQVTCYTPSFASLNTGVSRIHTGRGIRLGDSIDQITGHYGEPNEKQVVNAQEVRLRYNLGYETDRYYQWTLTFRDGRLVEWTADAIPFFIEVGG